MGHRVHVCKKYEIEYGETTDFNNNNDKFYDLLHLLGGEPMSSDGEGNAYDDNFECAVNDYDDAIRNLGCYINDPDTFNSLEENECDDGQKIAEILEELDMTATDLLATMEAYRKEADVRDGYIHFSNF